MSTGTSMDIEFECPICCDVATDAVETSCCHHIFCEECIASLQSRSCPNCRQTFTLQPAHFARRIIGNLPLVCPWSCGDSITRSNLTDHERFCPNRLYTCSADGCEYKGNKPSYAKHMAEDHLDLLVSNADVALRKKGSFAKGNASTSQRARVKEIFDGRPNSKGKLARLGETGKFYCGGRLSDRCICCDGQCGPTNGCNCESCMRLDVEVRELPRQWLVNRLGAPCTSTSADQRHQGTWYCGRRVNIGVPGCDGYCGPNDGPSCDSCRILKSQAHRRYRELL